MKRRRARGLRRANVPAEGVRSTQFARHTSQWCRWARGVGVRFHDETAPTLDRDVRLVPPHDAVAVREM